VQNPWFDMQIPASQERHLELSRAINDVSVAILRGDTTSGVLQSLVDIAGPALQVDRALIYDVQFSSARAVKLSEWLRPGGHVVPANAEYPLAGFESAAREMARTGAPIESSRDSVHPLLAADGTNRLLHEQMSIQRLLWYPFRLHHDGYYLLVFSQVIGSRPWKAEELDFIEVVAAQVSLAIMKLELLRERERAATDLRQSEARYRLLYDNTPSMFFTVDSGGVVRGVNRFAVEHLGYAAEELIGQNVLRVVHPQDHAQVQYHLDACFADPGAVRTVSFRKICRDGSIIWVKEVTRVVEGPDGASALIICEDVTESRAHEAAALQAASEVHDKDEFMAMLGHELRNPLSPIVTALDILRRRGLQDPELDVIDRQVSHLRRLVDDLLDISRITRGKVELHKEVVELAEVAAQAVEVARPLFQRKRQTLYVAVASRGLAVDADPARLVQAFANLLTNAGKYSAEGSEVHFSAERRGDRILIRVRDHGEGIEPEMLERVFDLFVQRPQPADRAQSGLGLGLTIVRNLITLHGGTVHALSEGRGKGTTVEVELPAAPSTSLTPAAPVVGCPADSGQGFDTRATVLVVDDNDDVRESLCRLLALMGYLPTGASDGPSALEAAGRIKPHVAVVDIGLPGMDGYEVARQLRRTYPTGLRLVAVTGYGQDSDREQSRDAGFDAHLVKPIDLNVLLPHLLEPS
jgi:PAS domain S-box-containing protein